jgi:hypothetical protein
MNKNAILNNVNAITAEELYNFIKEKIVTLEELRDTGELSIAKRNKIKELLSNDIIESNEAWNSVRKDSISELENFISKYPQSDHFNEAENIHNALKTNAEKNNRIKQEIISNLRSNHNKYNIGQIIRYLNDGTITLDNLHEVGIPKRILEKINRTADGRYAFVKPTIILGDAPELIPEGYTEVYFWGMKGSGKTCALGAILNTGERAGLLRPEDGYGQSYTTQLKNLFYNTPAILPNPTSRENNQYLGFTLKKPSEKNERKIALVEISGEIYECFYNHNARLPMEDDKQTTFDALVRFLSNKQNKKIHFFFIDYEKDNTPNVDGLAQVDFLNAASNFFTNHEDIFNKSTDAIYVVLTKSDLLNCTVEQEVPRAIEFLEQNYFMGFIASLKDVCKKNSINNGKLTIEPFTLGNIYLKDFCDFNDRTALNIINILLERVKPFKKSWFDGLKK